MPTTCATPPTAAGTETAFLEHLPRFTAHAGYAFRHVRCPETRADLAAEAVALAWKHFAALSRRGRRPERFVATLARRCAQAVRAGRRLVRGDGARDVLSPVARARHGFAVGRLPERDRAADRPGLPDEVSDALADNTKSPVPAQAAFRLDFPRWRSMLGRRDRAVLDALAGGERTRDAAGRFGVSPARVSQLRRRAFEAGWRAFQET